MKRDIPDIITLHNGQQVINPSKELVKQVQEELIWLSNLCKKINKEYSKK